MANLNRSAVDLDRFVRNTDASLNGSLFPQLASTVHNVDLVASNLSNAAAETTDLAEHGTKMIDSLNKTLNDPANHATMQNLADTTQHTAEVTKNLVAITDDGRKVADHYTAEIMKPVTKIKLVVKAIAHYGTLFFGAFLGAR